MSEYQNNPEPDAPKENEIADYYEGVKKLEMDGHETGIKKQEMLFYYCRPFTAGRNYRYKYFRSRSNTTCYWHNSC